MFSSSHQHSGLALCILDPTVCQMPLVMVIHTSHLDKNCSLPFFCDAGMVKSTNIKQDTDHIYEIPPHNVHLDAVIWTMNYALQLLATFSAVRSLKVR